MIFLRLIRACAASAVVFNALAAGAVFAQSTMFDRVRIELRGVVAPQCSFQDAPTALDLGVLGDGAAAARKQLTFRISCNAPFSYSLSSAHGAMQRETALESGGASLLTGFPYRAALAFSADNGGSLGVSCGSAELGQASANCAGRSSDGAAIDQDALLTLSWGPIDGRLAAGRYADDLRVVFSVRI